MSHVADVYHCAIQRLMHVVERINQRFAELVSTLVLELVELPDGNGGRNQILTGDGRNHVAGRKAVCLQRRAGSRSTWSLLAAIRKRHLRALDRDT